ncbi:iron chelate uptake ABC transporter family permease subunit [Clostridium formicaceticum]|uniref:Iron ABC transporter permease n=1 Tax=Clostridium formicaceticum TaxID=1497 RepID=A0AAC9WHF3_9CLOT|nr:iron chelate uptake ABC transporter family permease subunit [Clostridium formicaceticum]AOY77117.1 iron ABC transporter permease [Clostridium formicaceticum]ARE87630.1 Iron(3+)-hydroxamate import system permease protein FhuB [Clostridium formicaceticum]
MSYKKKIGLLTLLSVVLIVLFLSIGLNANNWNYALSRRIPKIIAIVLTGSIIAFSSMVFQTITNNRILTPSVLGLDALYMFIQTLVVFIFAGSSLTVVSRHTNFLLSVALMIAFSSILYKFIFKKEQQNIYFLLLVGLIFSTLFQSLSSFMQMLIDPNEFGVVQSRMFASFNNVNTDLLLIAVIMVLSIGIYIYPHRKILDVLSLGREEAINLGVDYDKSVKRILIVVIIMVSVATALVGPITFLGLLVVNLARELLNTYQHKYLIITSILMSSIALVGGQLVIERVLNFKTPLSVIINLVGGLYFIYLLLKENKA